jgi:hypothetical protein
LSFSIYSVSIISHFSNPNFFCFDCSYCYPKAGVIDYYTEEDVVKVDKENRKAKEDESFDRLFSSKQEGLGRFRQFLLPRFQNLGENFSTNKLKMLFTSNLCHHTILSIHESGHAVSDYYCAAYGDALGVSIKPSRLFPKGVSWGKTTFGKPSVDTICYHKASMSVSLSGRSAEECILGHNNTWLSGASDDIKMQQKLQHQW